MFDHFNSCYQFEKLNTIMGAWGPKTFEDDTAMDWIAELVDSDDERTFLLDSIQVGPGSLEADECSVVLAASETVVAILDEPRPGLPEELADWLADNDCDDISDLPAIAVKSVTKVLGEDSELNELWQEGEGYEEWRAEVEQLQEILKQLALV